MVAAVHKQLYYVSSLVSHMFTSRRTATVGLEGNHDWIIVFF